MPVAGVGYEATDVASTTLYFHFGALGSAFPINTQEPAGTQVRSAGGTASTTLSCLPEVPGVGLLNASFHTFYGTPVASYVEATSDGLRAPHASVTPEHDLSIDTAAPAAVYLYLEQGLAESSVGADAVATPQVMVRATLRTGADISVGDEAFNEGDVVAVGEAGPLFLDPRGVLPGPAPFEADGATVYEVALPLAFSTSDVPGGESFNVRIDLWVEVPGCEPDETIMPDTVRLWSSPDARSRLEWSVQEPLSALELRPWFLEDVVYINASVLSRWGVYDVDEAPGGVTLTIDGPTEASRIVQTRFEQRHDEHFFLNDPVHAQWAWPYKEDGAAAGTYNVTLTAWNDQRTAQAVAHAAFTLGPRTTTDADGRTVSWDDAEAPGAPLALLLAALVAVAARARGRADPGS